MTGSSHLDSDTHFRKLAEQALANWPEQRWSGHKTLVAVSGGPDSVALLLMLRNLYSSYSKLPPNEALIVAHFNHQTRGSESDDDQQFVEELARRLGLPIVIGQRQDQGSTNVSEESLRNERYEFLQKAAQQTGARYVATGHHREDQIETILFRFLRGTGIAGLAGMPVYRKLGSDVVLIRPLLSIEPSELQNWLEEIDQDFRSDSSNHQTNYSRNFLRAELMPLIDQHFESKTRSSIRRISEQAQELNQFLDRCLEPIGAFAKRDGNAIVIDGKSLAQADRILVKRLLMSRWKEMEWPLQPMTHQKWESLCDLVVEAATGGESRAHFPGKVIVTASGGMMRLTRPD